MRAALLIKRIEENPFLARKRNIILSVGIATFFFGFGAAAILNIYLYSIHSPLVESLRSSLTYKSAILGDGILLPIINMIVASYLLNNRKVITQKLLTLALIIGGLITIYFHISQAVNNLVNWAMPTPWHWNLLGLWHAIYMFSVSSLLALFYLVTIKLSRNHKRIAQEVFIVTLGILLFFILLHLDYVNVKFNNLIPQQPI